MQDEFTSGRIAVDDTDDAGDTFTVNPPYSTTNKGFTLVRRSEPRQSSAQRLILTTLKNASHDNRHLSIDDIFRQLMHSGEKISHSTIYRTLAKMEAERLVIRHQFVSGASVFEFSAPERHDHFVEIDSSKIIDFQSEELEQLLLDIVDRHDMELLDYKMVLFVRPDAALPAQTKEGAAPDKPGAAPSSGIHASDNHFSDNRSSNRRALNKSD